MKEGLEFDIVIFKNPSKSEIMNREKLLDMGISYSDDEEREESLSKYTFIPKIIIEFNKTLVSYNGEDKEAVICTYLPHKNSRTYQTPPLVVSYEKFKERIREYYANNKKNTETQ